MTAVEGYTLRQQPLAALRGPSPLLRLASDERLIALTRTGQPKQGRRPAQGGRLLSECVALHRSHRPDVA